MNVELIEMKKLTCKIRVPAGDRAKWEKEGFAVIPPPAQPAEPVKE